MKNLYLSTIILLTFLTTAFGQNSINMGIGYFGHTITHPGLVFEAEYVRTFSSKSMLIARSDIGFYKHPRYHTGIFLDAGIGFRRMYKSGLFLEENLGFGILEPYLNSDGVFEVKDDGTIKEASRFSPIDLMPSVTLGLGYDLSKDKDMNSFLWIRPKVFWQYPHKTSSSYHVALQVGFSYCIQRIVRFKDDFNF